VSRARAAFPARRAVSLGTPAAGSRSLAGLSMLRELGSTRITEKGYRRWVECRARAAPRSRASAALPLNLLTWSGDPRRGVHGPFQPSLRDFGWVRARFPTLKRGATFMSSLRDWGTSPPAPPLQGEGSYYVPTLMSPIGMRTRATVMSPLRDRS